MTDTRKVVEAFWACANSRDWDGFGALLADDVLYEIPQTRERVRGREAYVRFNAAYPEGWSVTIERLVADGDQAVTWINFIVDGDGQPGLTFFQLDETGKIARITDFWPEPYPPPPGREHLVERY